MNWWIEFLNWIWKHEFFFQVSVLIDKKYTKVVSTPPDRATFLQATSEERMLQSHK